MLLAAVRKNRYVILPVDFEEAWKVSCLAMLGKSIITIQIIFNFVVDVFFFYLFPHHSKRSRGRTKPTNSVRFTCASFLLYI